MLQLMSARFVCVHAPVFPVFHPWLLLSRLLTPVNVDIIFSKVKSKGCRRLTYAQFLDTLALMSATKFPSMEPTAAFTVLLDKHVLQSAAAIGLTRMRQSPRAAVAAGDTITSPTLQVSPHMCVALCYRLPFRTVGCRARLDLSAAVKTLTTVSQVIL